MRYRLEGTSRIIRNGQAFTDKRGNIYDASWLENSTPEEQLSAGVSVVSFSAKPVFDSLYYTSFNVAKPLEDIQTERKDALNNQMNRLLQPTDWYILRKMEDNTAIPQEVVIKRNGIHDEGDRVKAAIDAATSIDEVKTALDSVNFPI